MNVYCTVDFIFLIRKEGWIKVKGVPKWEANSNLQKRFNACQMFIFYHRKNNKSSVSASNLKYIRKTFMSPPSVAIRGQRDS